MSGTRSVRSRLLIGSIFWTAGLLAIAHLLSIFLIRRMHVLRVNLHSMILTAAVLMGIGIWILMSGVSPLEALRAKLAAVREGRERRLEGKYPYEVQPLVSDLNALLDHREDTVRRALAKAGDLAHGLKTPLAILQQEAERAEANGHHELAATISQQVERMRRQVEYHLAHARAAGSGATVGAHASVAAAVEALSRTLLQLHSGRGIAIEIRVPPEHFVRCEREDLEEILGNVLDNACKWARSKVAVSSTQATERVTIVIDDDGPGLDASMRESVMQRGVRADEAAPGSGLGLAIARDVAELYGGSITLDAAAAGGLRARVELPS